MRPRPNKLKFLHIVGAKVRVPLAKSDEYEHATLTLDYIRNFGSAGDSRLSIMINFQRHNLVSEHPITFQMPDPLFDVGITPMSGWYAGSFNCFMPLYEFAMDAKRLQTLIGRIGETVREYNIDDSCELAMWWRALEKLGVPREPIEWYDSSTLRILGADEILAQPRGTGRAFVLGEIETRRVAAIEKKLREQQAAEASVSDPELPF